MTLREHWQSSSLQACLLRLRSSASFLNVDLGYYTDRSEFEKRVEEDATAFKPCGELIYSYTRPAPIKGKGKGVATCAPATEDDIVYEVYHVVFFLVPYSYSFTYPDLRLRGIPQAFVHTIRGCNYSYYYMSRQARISLRMRILGNLLFCESWFFLPFQKHTHILSRYEKRKRSGCDISTYHFIGYSSLYGFYHFPEKTRLRLSQFIIVSPYQKKGHGC